LQKGRESINFFYCALAFFISFNRNHLSIHVAHTSVMKLFKTLKTPKIEADENIIYKIIHFRFRFI